MSKYLRTFVAIRCAGDIASALHERAEALLAEDSALRIPEEDDFHITLHFLGHTLPEEIHRVARVLTKAAEDTPPFTLEYEGLGAFPTTERPRAIWARVQEAEGGQVFLPLVHRIREGLEELGYPAERRRFQPHVTLARTRGLPKPAILEALTAEPPEDFGLQWVSSLRLISSESGRGSYHYIDLTTIPLTGEPTNDGFATEE